MKRCVQKYAGRQDARATCRLPARKTRRTRRLQLEALEDRRLLAVLWDGEAGDGLWHTAANWSTNQVPGAGDDVVLNVAATTPIAFNGADASVSSLVNYETLQIESGTLSVSGRVYVHGQVAAQGGGLDTADLVLRGGSLTVTGAMQVTGRLVMEPGSSLTASGGAASFQAAGETRLMGASLYALAGGHIALPDAADYTLLSTGNSQTRTLRAEGAGSLLSLGNVLAVLNGTHYGSRLKIEAVNGGQVDLSKATQIVDSDGGDVNWRAVDVLADGTDSRIELDALVSFTDVYGTTTSGYGLYSSLAAVNGGTVDAPQLVRLQGVNLSLDGTGTIPVGQITHFTQGRLALSGANHVFGSLVDLSDSDVQVTGVTPQLPNVTRIGGADLLVREGGNLAFPSVTRYAHASTGSSQVRTLRAEGDGSVLDLSHVLTVTGGTHYDSRLKIEAVAGGQVNLSQATQIVDPDGGDVNWRAVDVKADGTDSRIDLNALVSLTDVYGTTTWGYGLYSSLTASAGGALDAPQLARLQGVNLVLDGTGTIPVGQITHFTQGRLVVSGANYDFAALVDLSDSELQVTGVAPQLPLLKQIDGADLLVAGGGTLSLPSATSYAHASTGNDQVRTLRAEGAGTVLDLSHVLTVTGGTHYDSRLKIEATGGGQVNLSQVTQIVDPDGGDANWRAVYVKADGAGSRIELDALARFTDLYGTTTSGYGLYSSLTASAGGVVDAPQLTTLQGVNLVLDGTDAIPVGQITHFTQGRLVVSGANYDFAALLDLSDSELQVTGVNPQLPLVARIDGADLLVAGGGTLSLPSATSYSHASTGNDQVRTLRAEGTGSVLDLSHVLTVTGGTHYDSRLKIEATGGGQVNLSQARQVTELNTGNLEWRAVDVLATGEGSRIEFDALVSFTDLYGTTASGYGLYSSLTASNGGTVDAPQLTRLQGVNLTLDGTGTIAVGQITHFTHGRLAVSSSGYAFDSLVDLSDSEVQVTGVALQLPHVTRINGADLRVLGGGTLALPSATHYAHASTGNSQTRTLRAEGAGSLLDLSHVLTVTGGTYYDARLKIEAAGGGRVDLSHAAQIVDPDSGDVRWRAVDVLATGENSRIEFDALESITDRYGWATSSEGLYSSVTATQGGTVNAPQLARLAGVNLTLDGTGTMPVGQITHFTQGRLALSGANYEFTGLVDLSDSEVQVTGATALMPNVTRINGADLRVLGGGTLALPSATHYAHASTGNSQTRTLRAEGAGSLLDLSHVLTVTGGTSYAARLKIEAAGGGRVDLSHTAQIVDPDSGDMRWRAVDVLADGTGSVLDLSSLERFIDRQGTASSGDALWSTLRETNQGDVQVTNLVITRGVFVSLSGTKTPLGPAPSGDGGVTVPDGKLGTGPDTPQPAGGDASGTPRGSGLKGGQKGSKGAVTWVGTDGDWSTASNWSTGVVPGQDDDVAIDVPDTAAVITISSGSQQVHTLMCEESLSITGGALTVTGDSVVNGPLTMSPGTSLTADGPLASFSSSGTVAISGANLLAIRGGDIVLPALTVYAHASTGNSQTRTLRAEGPGSVLDLSSVLTVTGGTHYDSRLRIEAVSGGQVNLSRATQIVDPAGGDVSWRAVSVKSEGVGSRIEFAALAGFTDLYGTTTWGYGLYSSLTVRQGGTVDAPQLTTLQGVNLVLDGTGTIPVGQITDFTHGRLVLSGANYDFAGLANLGDSEVCVSGVVPQMPLVTQIDGVDLLVADGGSLALPSATSYTHASTGNSQVRTLRAEGGGSVLDLSHVLTVTGGAHYDSRLRIEAVSGGQVNLSQATQIVDPSGGDASWRAVEVKAEGVGSRIEFDALGSFTDLYGTTTWGYGLYSSLTARAGGTVNSPQLATLQGVHLVLDGTGAIPVGQITHFTHGRLAVRGANYDFAALVDVRDSEVHVTGVTPQLPLAAQIDGADLLVVAGGTLSLPSATSYAHASTGNDQVRTLRAEGTGSVLDLSHVLTVTNGTHYDSRLKIEAVGGGQMNLSQTTQITELNSGNLEFRAVDVKADGPGSRIEFDALVSFTDLYGTTTSSYGLYSSLTARQGGAVDAPQLTELQGVNVVLDGTGTIPVAQIAHFTHGRLALSVVNYAFTGLVDLRDSEVQVTGVAPQLTSVTQIDGADLLVTAGGTLSLPAATSYAHASAGNSQTRTLQAEGVGSVLDMSHVLTLTNGTHYNSRLKIEAVAGGQVDLSQATQIADPDSGDLRWRAVDVQAQGVGSRIELDALASFTDPWGWETSGDGLYSSLTASAGGTVDAAQLTQLQGVNLVLDGTGTIPIAQITHLTKGRLILSNANYAFASLVDLSDSDVQITGAAVQMPLATQIDGADLLVAGGGAVSLPSATDYAHVSTGNSQTRTLRAEGAGSVLDLGNVLALTNGTHYNSRLRIEAVSGGQVNLGQTTQIADPDSGDLRWRAVDVKAEGAGSRIELDTLANFTDPWGWETSGDGLYSSLTAANGGTVDAPQLTELQGVNLVLDGTGSIPIGQITHLTNGRLALSAANHVFTALVDLSDSDVQVTGVAPQLPLVTQIDGADLLVSDGGTLSLPAATSYAHVSAGNYHTRTLRAEGAGSVLDLSHVLTLTGGTHYGSRLKIDAASGGRVNLSQATQITDPDSGDIRVRAVDVKAEGVGSRIELNSLAGFTDRSGTATSGDGLYSSLDVSDLAVITVRPAGTSLAGVQANLGEWGTAQGSLDLQGTSLLTGVGTLLGNVLNAATVAPGGPPGKLTIDGDYTQTAVGKLVIEIVGLTPVTQYDQLTVTGDVALDGTLDVVRLNNYLPALGDEFTVVLGATRTGLFNSITGLAWGSSIKLSPIYNPADFRLRAGTDAGPRVVGVTPSGTIDSSLRSFQLTFDEALDLSAFKAEDITLTGPNGPVTVNDPTLVSGTIYAFTIDTQVAPGNYDLSVGPNVNDAAGNAMDQNGNLVNGEPEDVFTHSVAVSNVEQAVLMVNVHGSYNTDGANFYQDLLAAGARAKWLDLDVEGEVAAALAANVYDQVWIFDLSTAADNYAADWQALANWYTADPNVAIVCDARIIASLWSGRWQAEGLRLTKNYYENLKTNGGGLFLGTDDSSVQTGINALNGLLGLEPFSGSLHLSYIPVDTANPLMTTPHNLGSQLANDSGPGQTPYGVQPNGRVLYPVAWHNGSFTTPGIAATIPGTVGFHVEIAAPPDGATFPETNPPTFIVTQEGGLPDFVFTWTSNLDGTLGTGDTLAGPTLSPGTHTITVLGQDELGAEDTDSIVVHVTAVAASVQLDLQAASDTGGSNTDNITRTTAPVLDVVVNKAGRIDVDFQGDGQVDQTQTVAAAGTYSFTAPVLDDGVWPMRAVLQPVLGSPATTSLSVTIDNLGPQLLPGAATEQAPLESRQVRFNEAIDYQTSLNSGLVVVMTAPGGANVPVTGISGGGTTYTLSFAPQVAIGQYQIVANTSLFDWAGNPIDQDGDGTNGEVGQDEPEDVFTLLADVTPPAVMSFSPVGFVRQDVSRMVVNFTERMQAASFTGADVVVTGPSGTVDPANITVAPSGATQFEITLPAQTAEGDYQVRIGPAVQDLAGNALAAAYQAGFTLDKTAPSVLSVIPAGTVGAVVSFVDVVFSEPLQAATVQAADLTLTGLNGAVAIGGPVLVAGNTYRFPCAAQRANGEYSVSVGPVVLDRAGNPLAAAHPATFTIALPDFTVADVTPARSTATLGETLNVTWNVNNGGAPLSGPWLDAVYLSADAVLDASDRLLALVLGPGPTPPANSATLTLPLDGSLAPGDWYVIVAADDGHAIVEADEGNNTQASGAPVTLSLPPLPDLVPADITAPTAAAPGSSIAVAWTVHNAGGATAVETWTESVYLSADAAIGDDLLLATFTYSGPLAPADPPVARSETVTLPAWGWAGDVRMVVRVDAGGQVFEADETNNAAIDDQVLNVPATLSLALPLAQVREDDANPVMRGVVTRGGSLSGPLTVALSSSQTDELTVPATVTIADGQPSAAFFVTVHADGIADGNQSVTLTATAAGYVGASQEVVVVDVNRPVLSLSLTGNELTEGDTVTGKVRRDLVTSQPVLVTLSASRIGDLDFPASLTIPADEAEVAFSLSAVDDEVPEQTEAVTLTATAAGHLSASASVSILDNDEPTLSLVFSAATVSEGAGSMALVGTVARAEATGVPLTVRLTSSDLTEAVVPAEVVIPAAAASVNFYLAAIDDTLVDGVQPVTIQAVGIIPSCGCGMPPGGTGTFSAAIQVLDDDGPTLSVVVDRALLPEGQVSAAAGRVFRNTGTSGLLTIALQSGDLSELSVPATVVIPDGADSSDPFLVTTLQDGEADGPQTVTITASAAGFTAGTASVIVTDIDVPDLVVTDLAGPASVYSEAYDALSYTVRNVGLAAAVAANADPPQNFPGSWQDRVFLSKDTLIGGDILIGTYTYTGTLPTEPDLNHYSRSVPFRAPMTPGDYWLVVTTDLGQMVAEGIETNNTVISAEPIHVTAAYTATVQTDVELSLAGTPVPMYGQATEAATGGPAAYVLVNIHLAVRGTTRVIAALADENGHFTTTFRPLPGEGGRYEIAAAHPGVSEPGPAQDTFVLQGMRTEPSRPQGTVDEGGSETFEFALGNLSDVPLTGLAVAVQAKPDNLNVTLPAGLPTTLLGLESVAIAVDIAAVDASVQQGTVVLRFTTAEGATLDVPIDVTVRALRAKLVPDTPRLLAAALRGAQTPVELQVTNVGAAASGPIEVQLPDLSWLTLATPSTMDSLAPQASAAVVLLLSPPADAVLTAYEGSLILATADDNFAVPFTFRVVSAARGNLRVTAVDEFYFYTAEAPKLAGATVLVRDAVSRQELLASVTDESGSVLFPDLTEGYYTVEVQAVDHDTYSSTLFLEPDRTNDVLAYLRRQTVKYVWSVEPTEIEDHYEIHIETVFETNVPAPVVTVDPPLIDMSELLIPGQRMQVDLTLTNHGLISAFDTELYFGDHPEVKITPLVRYLGELPAKSSMTVPVLIERVLPPKAGSPGAGAKGSDICHIPAFVVYNWVCIDKQWVSVPVGTVPPRDFACPPGLPGGGGIIVAGGPAGPGGGIVITPVQATKTSCDPCLNEFLDLVLCFLPLDCIPGGILGCAKDGAMAGLGGQPSPSLGDCLIDIVTGCLMELIPGSDIICVLQGTCGLLKCLGALDGGGLVSTVCDFITNPFGKGVLGGCGLAGAKGIALPYGGALGTAAADYLEWLDRLLATLEPYLYVYGDYSWILGQDAVRDVLGAFHQALTSSSDAGIVISEQERQAVLAEATADGVGTENVTRLIDRWNRTQEYWQQGTPTVGDLPPGANTDFIDAAEWLAKWEAAEDAFDEAAALGYATVIQGFNASLSELQTAMREMESGEGVCAQVRIRLDQDAVMAREAFRATLELENSTAAALDQVAVQIVIRDTAGNDVTDLFAIRDPVLNGIDAVDGTGSVAAGVTGVAEWIIIPTSEAALDVPTEYLVSGTLQYSENGVLVTTPLFPVSITVHPQAELDLTYFHQRDVFSDDPWTDEIEPAQPYALAVMVENKGAGDARNLQIVSAQPQIVENDKGLLIDFQIIATEVAGQNLTPSLTANFGDLAASEIKIGQWWLTSTLQGQFIQYDATFEHIDGLGDPRLSLIKNVSIHELIHTVSADRQFEDNLPDFLVNDLIDDEDLPDTLYLSDGSQADVLLATNAVADGPVTPQDLIVQLTTDMPGGWGYLRMQGTDPGGSDYRLVQVLRSDGSELPVQNFWQTDRTFIELGRRPRLENNLHLFDYTAAAGTQTYTLIYEKRDQFGPAILSLETPDSPRSAAVVSLETVFSEPLAAGSFDWHDLTLRRDAGPVTLDSRVTISQVSGGTYRIDALGDFTLTDGLYELTLDAAGLTDPWENPGQGLRTVSWTKAAAVPYVVAIGGVPAAWWNTSVESIDVEFSQPISAATFSAADLTLTRNGGANLIDPQTSALTFVQTGETTYRIGSLAGTTLAEGNYQLTVSAAGVTDLAGNAGVGQRSVAWTMDTTPPTVVSLTGVGAATNQAVAALTLTFSERLNAASLNSASLSLSHDGGPNLLVDPLQVVYLEGGAYSLAGLYALTGQDGGYVLSVSAAQIRDLAGNAGAGSSSLAWTRDSVAPAAAANLTITPDTGVSNTDRRTNSLNVVAAGELAEPGLTVALFDLTTGTDLGPATVTGLTFTGNVQFTSGGLHELRVRVTDAAGNYADRSWDVFVDLVSPLVAGVSAGPNPATGKVDQIVVTFSEAMAIEPLIAGGSIVQAVTLVHAVAGPYTLTPDLFQYDAAMRRLTLTPAALTPGVHELRLDGSRLFDLAGNPLRGGSAGVVVLDIPAFALEQFVQAGGTDIQVTGHSVPSLADWDGDGRPDLLVGEKTAEGLGQVRVYLNTGTAAAPVFDTFTYAQSGGAALTVPAGACLGVFPRLFDWDGDGLPDLLLGLADGTIQWRRNVGVAGAPQFDSGTLLQAGPAGDKAIIDVGDRATPAIFDWNADGRQDLVVGALDGRILVYLNTADAGPGDLLSEQLVLDGSGELIVPSGRSSVAVADLNGDGRADLVVGNTAGQLLYYANVGSSGQPRFDALEPLRSDNVAIDLAGDPRSRPFVVDYNGDGRLDVLVGAADGRVRLYLGQATPATRPLPHENTGEPGGVYVYTFVPLQGPTDLALAAAVVPEAQPPGQLAGTLTAADPDAGEVFTYALTPGAGDGDNALFQIVGDRLLTAAVLDYETQSQYAVRVRVTDHTGLWYEEALTVSIVDVQTLTVTEFTSTVTGFTVRFDRELDASVLNLYDSPSRTLGAADVTVTGATQGTIRGSLLVSAEGRQITFVQTGGLLEPDTYTVTLFSGAARFRDTAGGALDGNADELAGDDYHTTFTVGALPAGTVVVSLPDMARGAGQNVNVPNTSQGLPIRISSADAVTSLGADLVYDQNLLAFTAATLAAGLPGDWSVVNPPDTSTPGVVKIRASGTTPLAGTNVEVVRLTAAVPSDALYGAIQALRLENVVVNVGTIAAVGDEAVHKAAYLGDVDSSGIHSSADAFLLVQTALRVASGFSAHAWTDPRIVGDADGSGVLSAADAFLIQQEGLGLVEPFVPDNPHIGVTPVGGGVDPQFQIDINLPASAGGLVTVPVKLAIEPAATNVGGFDFDLFFDPARLTIQLPDGVSAGADTARGWAVSARIIDTGHLRVGMVSSTDQPLAVGLREIARLRFHVAAYVPDAVPLAERAVYADAVPVSERPGYVAALDIEPIDARAGGYTWTDADGSVLIRPTDRTPPGAARQRVWRDLDAKADLLEDVLADLVQDLAAAWR